MAVLKAVSLLLIFYAIAGWAATERRLYLSILLWILPICSMAFKAEANVDGLIVLIALLFCAVTIYSLYGTRLWNIAQRQKGKAFSALCFVISTAVSFYFAIQGYSLGYMPFFSFWGKLGIYPSFLWAVLCAICSCGTLITAIDKYFSKKRQFILIKCSPYRGRNVLKLKQKGIKGVQNGKTYIFSTTYKAQFLLKNEKSLVMNLRIGVLGGMYASGKELFVNKNRQLRRVNRIIIRRIVFALLSVFVIVLFFYRVVLGISFENIIAAVMSSVFK